jgi:type IV pilus assembly protein PilO
MIMIGVGAAAIIYLYFFSNFIPFGHRALSEEKAQLEQEYRQLSSDLSNARQSLNDLEEIERQYELITRRWEVASELLPEQKEVASLLRKVTLVGQQSGVEFELFRPLDPVPGEIYNENPVLVQVVGGYHQVGSFLAEIANLDRIINVSGMTLSQPSDEAVDRTVQAKFTATAYSLNPAPATTGGNNDAS